MRNMILAGLLWLVSMPVFAQNATKESVLASARKANNYFMAKYADPTEDTNVNKVRTSNLWTRAVYYEGLMALYAIDNDERYIDYTDRWANHHKWTPRNGVKATNADDQCCSQTYLDRYMMTKDEKMIAATRENLKNQMAGGNLKHWTWIDAIQMALPVYAKMYQITGEREYIEHGMKMYRWSRNDCGRGGQNPDKGLFNLDDGLWWRDADFVPPYAEKDGNDCYWSRGNGWVLAALVRTMDCVSPKDKIHKELKTDFIMMCNALKNCQREDGFWNVSLESPVTFGGKETTGTALFLYGIAWGINHKYLKAKDFKPVCDRAWEAMERDALHPDGFLGWVQGTGKAPSAGQPLSYNKVPDFDDYGVGCYLLAASEYYKALPALP